MSDSKQGLGIGAGIRSLFWEDEPKKPAPETRNTPIPSAPSPSPSFAPTAFMSGDSGTVGPDPGALAKLEERLQKNCPPAYTSFMEQYDNLKEAIPDEGTRFKTALKVSHTTVDQLMEAVDTLLKVMDSAQADFQHSFDANKAAKIGTAEASLKAVEEQIASYEKQLQSVQETIASLRTKHDADSQAMAAEQVKIAKVQQGFTAALTQVVGRLNTQKSRFQSMPRV